MTQSHLSFVAIALLTLVVSGCSAASGDDIDGTKYLGSSEPEGAIDVIEARKSAADGDEIVVVGRIGGKRNPWLDNRAIFLITDSSLKSCDQIEGDTCKTPWDYCCASGLKTSRATVKVVDEHGDVVKSGAKKLLNLKELQTVVVRGKAKRIEGGNLIILASKIYVRK